MQFKDTIAELAKDAALLDPNDFARLVSVKEKLESLADGVSDHGDATLGERSRSSAESLERIILREIDDCSDVLSELNECIEHAQRVADALESEDPIDDELLAAWVAACGDSLTELEGLLLNMEADAVDDIRRRIHTLKGECGVLSMHDAQRLLHEAESMIDRAVDAGHDLPTDSLLQLVDWMKDYSAAVAEDPNANAPESDALRAQLESGGDGHSDAAIEAARAAPADEPAASSGGSDLVTLPEGLEQDEILIEFMTESREHIATAEEAVLTLEQTPGDNELINAVFRSFHTIKGVAGFMKLEAIVEVAHNAEFLLDKARDGTISIQRGHLDLVLASCDMLSRLLSMLEGGAAPTVGEMRGLIDRLEAAANGEPVAASGAPAGAANDTPADIAPAPVAPDAPGKVVARSKADQTVKVNTTRLDNLVTMVGELVIAQQMVLQDEHIQEIDDQRFQRNLGHTGKIIRDLQEVAMSLRMVTLRSTFQRMNRLVRDVSAKMGKNIRFVMEGEDTELDRTVVEEIGDPLVHMIRNSCDHGIESGEERTGAGKSPDGTLTLRAYHQGGSIIIEVRDDGRGLDRDKILTKAIEKGIYTPDRELDQIPDGEVFNLIMLPGFSTATEVTDISGRGVGMDVVRRNIEAMRGKIEIQSEKGKGSTVRMALPLTMAIIDGMVVRVGSQRYVVPTLSIERSFRPADTDLHSVTGRGEMANVRGSLLPIYHLNQTFALTEGVDDPRDGLLLVLESNDSRCCLVVDEIVGQQQVVIKSLGQSLASVRGVSGGAILGDGRIALIVDVAGLVSEATRAPRS